MNVTDPNLSSLASTGASGAQQTGQTSQTGRAAGGSQAEGAPGASGSDDVHLSELVKNLRSLASDSPERQAKLEELARSYAGGTYQVNPEATASGIINDATKS